MFVNVTAVSESDIKLIPSTITLVRYVIEWF